MCGSVSLALGGNKLPRACRTLLQFVTFLAICLGQLTAQGTAPDVTLSETVRAHFSAAQEAQQRSDYAAADREYRAVLTELPNFAEVRMNLGLVYQLQNRTPEAMAEFHRALKVKPTLAGANKFVMLYRAQDSHGKSSLGYATSDDGVHVMRQSTPVMAGEAPYEMGGGVEDPRLVRIGDNNEGGQGKHSSGPIHGDAQLCLAISADLIHWKRQGVIMPAYKGKWNVGWTKSGAIVPEKLNGKYWMYYLADAANQLTQMSIAYSTDLVHWTDALDHPVLASRPKMFDSQVVEPGPAPLITDNGIFLVDNGGDDKNVYRNGWVLFDKSDPTKVLARAQEPIFEPVQDWEKKGQVPNVVFVEGLVRDATAGSSIMAARTSTWA